MLQEAEGTITPQDPVSVFYQDVPQPVASQAAAALLPISKSAFTTPSGPPAWEEPAFKDCCAYIRCNDDAAIPVAVQDILMQGSKIDWKVKSLASGHSPFLSQPANLASCLSDLAAEFAK